MIPAGDPGGGAGGEGSARAGGDVDPDVALFAQREKEATRAEAARKRAEASERKRRARGQELARVKDEAAERVRHLRRRGTTGPDGLDEAEAEYRRALTELMAHEEQQTGSGSTG